MLTKFEKLLLKGAVKSTSAALKFIACLAYGIFVLGAVIYGWIFVRTRSPIAFDRVLLMLLVLMEMYSISTYQSLIRKLHSLMPEEEKVRFIR